MLELTTAQQIAIWIMPILFAVTFHEATHAMVAYYFGDTTAKELGRLSLNPFHHIDLFGTIIVPIVILVLSQFSFVFGWAKPVPVRASNLNNPRRDMALVSLAGPLSNIVMALLWACCLKLTLLVGSKSSNIALFFILTSQAGILINLIIAFLNLIPIPPLDGGRVVSCLLPPKQAVIYEKIESFGFFILLLLIITGVLGQILTPFINWSSAVIRFIFHL